MAQESKRPIPGLLRPDGIILSLRNPLRSHRCLVGKRMVRKVTMKVVMDLAARSFSSSLSMDAISKNSSCVAKCPCRGALILAASMYSRGGQPYHTRRHRFPAPWSAPAGSERLPCKSPSLRPYHCFFSRIAPRRGYLETRRRQSSIRSSDGALPPPRPWTGRGIGREQEHGSPQWRSFRHATDLIIQLPTIPE